MTDQGQSYWDAQAVGFDAEPDHGLLDDRVREAWRSLLLAELPSPPADVLDVGCGTGSLAVLLAESGFAVHGVDFSQRMVEAAAEKAAAAGVDARFEQGDASAPPYDPASFDVVLCRHVLWALPDPGLALQRWCALLRPGGRLVLVEGSWSTGAGITAEECAAEVSRHRESVRVTRLDDPMLWGRAIDDERYLVTSPS